jgi:hypothetical protein
MVAALLLLSESLSEGTSVGVQDIDARGAAVIKVVSMWVEVRRRGGESGRRERSERAVRHHMRELKSADVHDAAGRVAAGVGEGVVLFRLGVLYRGETP